MRCQKQIEEKKRVRDAHIILCPFNNRKFIHGNTWYVTLYSCIKKGKKNLDEQYI